MPRRQRKKKQKEEDAFLNSLAKSVAVIKQDLPDKGKSYKTVMCALFQNGSCLDGDKCQFSHDINLEFNQGAFDIYTDLRDIKSEFGKEFELNKIAEEKERRKGKQCQSTIVCKFFLDAITKKNLWLEMGLPKW